jgi:Tfp pilus assembly protein PilW
MKPAPNRGMSLLELVIGTALGVSALGLVLSATGVGVRLLTHGAARSEVHDIADLAAEAVRFDLRRAGFAPGAPIPDAIALARPDRITVRADLDGNGSIDLTSEENTSLACLTGPTRISRIVGTQSLPLASEVALCEWRYFDSAGIELVPPVGGLDAADRQRIAAIELAFMLRASGVTYRASRQVLAGRRGRP